MTRSAIQTHPLNPRTIDKHSRKKLRESLQRDGLVETLVVNRRTMTLLSGHQRLSLLDDESEGKDYAIDVAVIDVDPSRERELLVRLNNHTLTGSYDYAGLESLLKDASVPLDATGLGFDALDLEMMFPDMPALASPIFDAKGDAAREDIDKLKAHKAKRKAEDKASDSAEFYVAFVGRTPADVTRLLERLGLDVTQRFHDIDVLFSHLGIEARES